MEKKENKFRNCDVEGSPYKGKKCVKITITSLYAGGCEGPVDIQTNESCPHAEECRASSVLRDKCRVLKRLQKKGN